MYEIELDVWLGISIYIFYILWKVFEWIVFIYKEYFWGEVKRIYIYVGIFEGFVFEGKKECLLFIL